jgi:hypothetical protein
MLLRIAAAVFALCLSSSSAHSLPTYTWDSRYVKPDDQWIEKVVVDPFGNLIVIGQFYDQLHLGIGHQYVSLGFADAFVAKIDIYGNTLWSHHIGDVRGDRVMNVAVDLVGNVICVGYVSAVANDLEAFIAKYAPDGTQRFLNRYGAGDGVSQIAMTVSTTPSKEIIVSGEFDDEIDFGGGPLQEITGRTFFMARLGQLGEHVWSKAFATVTPYAFSMSEQETGPDGETTLFGTLNDSVDWGNGTMTTAGNSDIFLVRFDGNGLLVWERRFGDAVDNWARSMAINESGQIAIAGHNTGTVNFGGSDLVSAGGPDPYVAVFTTGGAHVWSKAFGTTGTQWGQSVTWASNQDLLLVCEGTGTLDFGGVGLTNATYGAWVVRMFGSNGNHRWSRTFNATDAFQAQVEEHNGVIWLAGAVSGDADIGGGVRTGETDFLDIYVAKYGDALTGISDAPVMARLEQNIPNPFNPRTTIPYTLDAPGRIRIGIYDASGALVSMLDGGARPAGSHTVAWDGRDRSGKVVSSGVYFYRLEGARGSARKMVLLK